MLVASDSDPVCISDIDCVYEEQSISLLEAILSFSEIYNNDLDSLLDDFESLTTNNSIYYILDCCICYHLIIQNIRAGINTTRRKINQLLVSNLIQSWNYFCELLDIELEA